MSNNIIRVPRPKGLTKLPKNNEEKVLSYIISEYIRNGFHYLGISVTTPELAFFQGTSLQRIQALVVESSGAFSSLLTPDSQEAANKSLAFLYDQLLTWAYQDRYKSEELFGAAKEQLRYPNGIIKTNMASLLVRIMEQGSKASGTLINAINSLRATTQQGTSPLAPLSLQASSGPSKALTQAEALNLLQDMAQAALMNPNINEAIYLEEAIEGTPEVRARGAETEGTKSLKASNQELINEEIILSLDLD